MKTIVLAFALLSLTACASGPLLVTARFKPSKSGTVRMPIANTPRYEKIARGEVTELMKRFCAPLKPEVVEINRVSVPTGSSTAMVGHVMVTDQKSDEYSYVHFDCTETADEIRL